MKAYEQRQEKYKGYLLLFQQWPNFHYVFIYKNDKELMNYKCKTEKEASQKAKRYVNKLEGYTYHRTGRYLK